MLNLYENISLCNINDIIRMIDLKLKCLGTNTFIQTTDTNYNSDLFLFRIHYKRYHTYKPTIYSDELKEIMNKSILERSIAHFKNYKLSNPKTYEIGLYVKDLNCPTEGHYGPVPDGPYIFVKNNGEYIFKGTVNVIKKKGWKNELKEFLDL